MATPAENIQPAEQPKLKTALGQTRLIGVAGVAGSGKSTVCAHLAGELKAAIMHVSDPIKAALDALFGFPEGAWADREWRRRPLPMVGKTPRQLAQSFGTDWGRNLVNEDIWITTLIARWRESGFPLTIIPDVRFENEALQILRHGGLMLRVDRPGVERDAPAHASELAIPDAVVHQTIINDGTLEELRVKAEAAIRDHGERVFAMMQAAQNNANGQ